MMNYENILWEEDGAVGILTINRPKALNALNKATLSEIETFLDKLATDNIRALILTGAGDKSFVAGADIGEIRELDEKSGLAFSSRGNELFARIASLPIPVIAAVNGFALGGGCELAMACHLRIASEKAKFGQPEIKLGVIPGYGGTQRLPRLIGTGRAIDLLLTGRMIDANTALQWGLVNEVVPPEQTLSRAKEIAVHLASTAPVARKAMLEAVRRGMEQELGEALEIEALYFGKCCGTQDKNEGTTAFLEKRDAKFTGQ